MMDESATREGRMTVAVRRRTHAKHSPSLARRSPRAATATRSRHRSAWQRLGLDRELAIELLIVLGMALSIFSAVSLLPAAQPTSLPLLSGWRTFQEGLLGVGTVLAP